MIKAPFIYILSDSSLYNGGMVFDTNGDFCYAIESSDISDFINTSSENYIVIDPQKKTIFKDISEIKSIEIITNYFNSIFRENSPLIDSKEYFSEVFNKIIKGYTFENKNILDYGCGNRKYSSFFKSGNYSGFDIQLSNNENQSLIIKNNFDFVICNFVLEHVANPFEIIDNATEYLNSNGIFIISIPSLTFFEFLKYYFLKFKLYLPVFHLRTFSISSFEGCMSLSKLTHCLIENDMRIKNIVSVNSFSKHKILSKFKPFCYFGKQIIIISEKHKKNINK